MQRVMILWPPPNPATFYIYIFLYLYVYTLWWIVDWHNFYNWILDWQKFSFNGQNSEGSIWHSLLLYMFLIIIQDKIGTIQEDHKMEIERLLNKVADTEARLDSVMREQASSASPGSRSPPHSLNLALTKSLEERQSGEVDVRSLFRPLLILSWMLG